jgi:integration host factor subunit beta
VFFKLLTVKEHAMTKADLIDEVSVAGKIPRNESEIIVEAIFARIARSVSSGKKIEIRGFGSFGIRQHQARVIPNPRKTRAWVAVPAKRIPYFEPSKALKKFVNSSG